MKIDSDLLSRYSYLIFGFFNIKTQNGYQTFEIKQDTGFFIRAQGRLFLVSAKHTLTSWNPEKSQKFPSSPEKLHLRLFDKNNKSFYHIIDVKSISKTITGGFTYNDPDIYALEIKDDVNDKKIYSIEDYLNNDYSISLNDEIVTYGYPVDYKYANSEVLRKFETILPSLTKGQLLSEESPYMDAKAKQLSSINFLIEKTDNLPKIGCSGSPVFVKNNSKLGWSFCGVFANSSPEVPVSLVVKKQFVVAKIEELTAQ